MTFSCVCVGGRGGEGVASGPQACQVPLTRLAGDDVTKASRGKVGGDPHFMSGPPFLPRFPPGKGLSPCSGGACKG